MKKLVFLMLIVSMILTACGTTPELVMEKNIDTTNDDVAPSFQDVVAFQTSFPPYIDWSEEWKEYRQSKGENTTSGRAPSEAELIEMVQNLEKDGIYLTAEEEDFKKASGILEQGGGMFLVLGITLVSPIPGDEFVVLGYAIKEGVKYLLIVTASVLAIRTVGDLTIGELKNRTGHTDWKHDVRSVDAQTYINTLTGAPKNDPNMMCAVVRMTGGAIRYVMSQKVMPGMNKAIFGWYTRSTWGGAYIINSKEFPATSSLIEAFEIVACSKLPPAPPLPQ